MINVTEEYQNLNREVVEISKQLKENFSEEQKKLLNEILNLQGGMESEAARTQFVEGFKLGLCIAVECLQD